MVRQSLFEVEGQSPYAAVKHRILAIEGYPDCFLRTTPNEVYGGYTMQCGYANGYVILHPDHKYYGKHYDEIPVDVHGGLTFSEADEANGTWIVGFDTHHGGDNKTTCDEIYCRIQTINLYNLLNQPNESK